MPPTFRLTVRAVRLKAYVLRNSTILDDKAGRIPLVEGIYRLSSIPKIRYLFGKKLAGNQSG